MMRSCRCLFILIVLQFIQLFSYSQTSRLKFKNLNTNDGLSQGHVNAILKDSRGFMWFATDEGLNKYDGYNFTIYKHDQKDHTSITNNLVFSLLEDKSGNLWVGTANGINLFDREKEAFVKYLPDFWSSIRDIFEDSKKRIWLGTNDGLLLFDPAKNTHKIYQHLEKDSNSINDNLALKIAEDNNGELWISTKSGLNRFNFQTQKFVRYLHDPKNSKSIGTGWVKCVFKDSKGKIWVGTQGGGIALFDRKSNSFIRYTHDHNNSNSLSHNDILSFVEGNDGKLWIGTENGGISVFDHSRNAFECYKSNASDPNSLSNNSIYSLYKDDDGNIWAGTYSGGVNFLPRSGEKFAHYKEIPHNANSLSSNIVLSITGDSNGNIWIGTDGGGLNRFDRKKETFTHYRHDDHNTNSISTDYVVISTELDNELMGFGYYRVGFDLFNKKNGLITRIPKDKNSVNLDNVGVNAIYKDSQSNLWFGTRDFGGVYIYNFKTKTFTHHNSEQVKGWSVNSFLEDKEGNMWVGADGGLQLFDAKNNKFILYLNDPNNMSNNSVHSIMEDRKGNLWLGTRDGLNCFNKTTKVFSTYTEKNGLANNSIFGIMEDRKGNLWISSNKGISKFDPATKSCRNYDISDGLQSNSYKPSAWYKTPNGEMFFGGVNGFNVFHPDSIRDNSFVPNVWITNFQIFNKPVRIGEDSPLNKSIGETKEITLSYQHSVFTFEFAALNYTLPEKNQYAYMLEGFDKEWNYVGRKRTATYTNLDAGEYVFKVRGSNNDGVWNEEGTSVKIIITPPFWETWWFKTLITIIVIGSAYIWYRVRINVIKRQKEILEQQVKERTAEIFQQKEEIQAQAESLQIANTELNSKNEEILAQAENLREASSEISALYSEIKDSIRAAEVIQNSILPSKSLIKKHIPEFFILYKPKDVVSGDFYWFDEKDDSIILAAVDCTGHGVSGAFMSINSHHLLNQAIYPFNNPAASEILDRLNEGIVKALNQENGQVLDGMDIALCVIDKDKKKLQYAGANNPLYILRGTEFIQVKANKYAIGTSVSGVINKFTQHDIELQNGDIIYMFSDGYADQLGEEGTKFMYPRFRDLLLNISKKAMEAQLQALEESFTNWKGSTEQLDDILVIGFKI